MKAPDGVELGNVIDVAISSEGEGNFAIVAEVPPPNLIDPFPGHIVAVPFSALTISKGKPHELQMVSNADKEKFYEASEVPSSFFHSGGQVSSEKVAEIDRYFGIEPSYSCHIP